MSFSAMELKPSQMHPVWLNGGVFVYELNFKKFSIFLFLLHLPTCFFLSFCQYTQKIIFSSLNMKKMGILR